MRRPIIIVGTGRCGSTLLHRLLAGHDQLAWLSTFNEAFPTQAWLTWFSRAYGWPLPDRIKDLKAFPKPYEAYRFWEHFLPGFSRRDRPLTAEDVPAGGIDPVRRATERIATLQGKERFLVKVTGWSRIAYFDRIFDDAVFVSLRRDPRAVVSSWVQAGWLDVTSSPGSEGWEWGEVPADYLAAWRELGGDPTLSAAVKIRLDLDDIARNAARVPQRFHELSYEDLIARPEPSLRSICGFSGLDWTPAFERIVRSKHFYDPRGKWRRHLTEAQGERIIEFFARADASPAAGSPAGPSSAQGEAAKGSSSSGPSAGVPDGSSA
ncbi:MAG: sulfotransferase [Solirubrobacterales bacterium]|nr:sulfotransferase [Solirubrobacterales bacterium]